MWALMGATLGQSITTSMKPMVEATLAAAKRKKADKGKGKTYNLHEIHLLAGWSGVSNMMDIPSIWQQFQSTKDKLINKDNLWKKVKEWSQELGCKVDIGFYLGKNTTEDLTNMVMTGGGGVVILETAARRCSLLM